LTLQKGRCTLKVLEFFGIKPKRKRNMGFIKVIGIGVIFTLFGILTSFAAQPDPAALDAYNKKDYKSAAQILESQAAKTPGDPEVLTLLGSSYRNLGEFSKAEEILKKAYAQKSKDPAVLIELGQTYLALKKNKEALEIFQKGLSTGKRQDEFYNGLGLAQFALGDGNKADLSFRNAIQKKPDVAIYHKNLADVNMASQIFAIAAEEYKTALKYDSANVVFRYDLSRAYWNQKDFTSAVEQLKTVLRFDTTFSKAYRDMGRLFIVSARNSGDSAQYRQAIGVLSKYVGLDSTDAEAHLDLTRSYAFFRDFEEARAHAQKALAVNPKLCDAYFILGQTLQDSKRDSATYQAALDAFNQYESCLKQDPNFRWSRKDIEFFIRRGRAARGLADSVHYRMALVDFQKVLELDSTNTLILNDIGQCYYYLRDFEAAHAAYAKRLAVDATSANTANVYLNDAYALFQLERYSETAVALKKVLGFKSDFLPALTMLGETYIRLKDYPNALGAYEQVLQKDSTNLDALKYTGFVHLDGQKFGQALPYLDKAWKQVATKGLKPCDQTDLLTWLGQAHMSQKNNSRAKEFFQRCLDCEPNNKTCREAIDYLKGLKSELGADGSGE